MRTISSPAVQRRLPEASRPIRRCTIIGVNPPVGPRCLGNLRHQPAASFRPAPSRAYQPTVGRPSTPVARAAQQQGLSAAHRRPARSAHPRRRAPRGCTPVVPPVLRGRKADPQRPDRAAPDRQSPAEVRIEREEQLTLSNASPGRLTDDDATATIENVDPPPRALLAGFGRRAAVHEHMEERLQAPREAGIEDRFAVPERRPDMEREMALGFLGRLGCRAGVHPARMGGHDLLAGAPTAGTAWFGRRGSAAPVR